MTDEVNILLVEDNEGDILLTREAFDANASSCQLNVVRNGRDAIDFIFGRGNYAHVQRPGLILLDINLPGTNGLEVLQQVKSNEDTKNIPIIMLSTSSAQKDINMAYQLRANSYIAKPPDMEAFTEAIGKIEEFWINMFKNPV